MSFYKMNIIENVHEEAAFWLCVTDFKIAFPTNVIYQWYYV